MDTPVYDFVRKYCGSKKTRFHMPGHKGSNVLLECEAMDITEIKGADVLSHAEGIIKKSQLNASALFKSGATFYSTEGSSHCIKTMLAVIIDDVKRDNREKRPYIIAARNVHRAMIDACALLDIDVEFILSEQSGNICENILDASVLDKKLNDCCDRGNMPACVYVTSPDYLGNIADIKGLSEVCDKYDIPLAVDNAHGAYLAFLEKNLHPIQLGAAICCDSAHKTLPVLTGGAYIHISDKYTGRYRDGINKYFTVFGSTSPSYLIMQSLDLCNRYLADGYDKKLSECIRNVEKLKRFMKANGVNIVDTEPLKIVIDAAASGYTGDYAANELRRYDIECEYSDRQFVVLMITPQNDKTDFERAARWCKQSCIVREKKAPIVYENIYQKTPERIMTIREAVFSASEYVDTEASLGRICASETISCPPAVPIAVSGEIIDEQMVKLFKQYDIEKVCVTCKI